MYKAIKNFEVQGQSFKIGDNFPVELYEDRLLRAKKIEKSGAISEVSKPAVQEVIKEVETVEEIIEEKQELLIDNSSAVGTVVEEEKPSKKSKK